MRNAEGGMRKWVGRWEGECRLRVRAWGAPGRGGVLGFIVGGVFGLVNVRGVFLGSFVGEAEWGRW